MKVRTAIPTGAMNALFEFLLASCSRLIFLPLAWLTRRDPELYVIIGREHGRFLDNAKYFYAWLQKNSEANQRTVFVTEHPEVLDQLVAAGVPVASYPSVRGLTLLLRAGTIIIDTTDPLSHGRIGLLHGAQLVQIWHGAPLKEVELALHHRRLNASPPLTSWAIRLTKSVLGRYLTADVLISTSDHFTRVAFSTCFNAKTIVATGYPRNDILTNSEEYPANLVRINTDEAAWSQLAAHRAAGGRTILYAPTFRDDGQPPFAEGRMSLERLSAFAMRTNALLALKLHPVMRGRYSIAGLPGIVDIRADSDIYPLLREIDVLATDYSSIFFDYLLLDRPVLFYPYDYERYVSDERKFLFAYESMTPGPIARSADEFETVLADTLIADVNTWGGERNRVRRLVFDHADAYASRRLWETIRHQTD